MSYQKFEKEIAGEKLIVEIGKFANQADGSVFVKYGDTTILATVVMGDKLVLNDYLPLFVDYQEKFYAAGKIKGSRFIKREGRPSDESILTGRLIDRAVRPFFDQRIRNEIQIIITVLSLDEHNDSDVPSLFGASLALMISDIPWNGPVSGLRVGFKDDKIILNPSFYDRQNGLLDLILTMNDQKRIVMMEIGAKSLPNEIITKCVIKSLDSIQDMIDFQKEICSHISVKKRDAHIYVYDKDIESKVLDFVNPYLEDVLYGDKKNIDLARKDLFQKVKDNFPDDVSMAMLVIDDAIGKIFKDNIINNEKRPDFRKLDEIRSISGEVDVVPRIHGVGLFNRGDTQTLSLLTLGAPSEAQIIDEMENEYVKRFLHHYNFPPYSVGDVKPLRSPGRREIGHGALVEKALESVIPESEDFPYTIRLVTEVLGSNGSSSMASVCSSTLALLAGGVPIKEPVAGIAMGILEDKSTGVYKLLTDIQGPEDHYGEMDFKVAGTRTGVNAIQMDVKGSGMTIDMFKEALVKAEKARLYILDIMSQIISEPRKEISIYAPKIVILRINPAKIGDVIGSGGKIINKIIEKTNVKIDIEDDGKIFISGENVDNINEASKWIQELSFEPKSGEEYKGKVVKIMPFGAFINIRYNIDGLLHISEMAETRLDKVEQVLKEGDLISVIVKSVDESGKVNLCLKEKLKL